MLEQFTLILAQGDGPAPAPVTPQDLTGQPSEVQPSTPGTPGQTPSQQAPSPLGNMLPLLFLLLLVVMFFVMSSGQRREKKRRQAMLAAIKKGDRVQTVGGIIGTVVDLRDTEIVLKVDESTNTRLRFARSAIQNVIEGDKAAS